MPCDLICTFPPPPSGKDHPDSASAMNNLGMALSSRGQHERAEKLCADALAVYERALGPEHTSTLASIEKMAVVLQVGWGAGSSGPRGGGAGWVLRSTLCETL